MDERFRENRRRHRLWTSLSIVCFTLAIGVAGAGGLRVLRAWTEVEVAAHSDASDAERSAVLMHGVLHFAGFVVLVVCAALCRRRARCEDRLLEELTGSPKW